MKNHAPIMDVSYEVIKKNKELVGSGQAFEEKAYDVEIGIEVHDADGNLKETRNPAFKSYVGNFGYMIQQSFAGASPTFDNKALIKDTSDANPSAAVFKMDVTEAALVSPNPTVYGIWVGDQQDASGQSLPLGNSNTALDFDDQDLRRQFQAEGYVTGYTDSKLNFGATTVTFINNYTMRIKRTFTSNQPTNDIIIDEIGMVGKSGTDYMLLCRDGFNPAITMTPADVVTVYYDITVSDANGFVENWLSLLSAKLVGSVAVGTIRATNGNTSGGLDFSAAVISTKVGDAALTDDTYGVVIGGPSSLPPPTVVLDKSDYKLNNQLLEATFSHKAVSLLTTVQLSNKTTIGYSRDFENISGATAYVDEVGLYMREQATGTSYMMGRTKLEGVGVPYVAIAADEILRVSYKLSFPLGLIPIS